MRKISPGTNRLKPIAPAGDDDRFGVVLVEWTGMVDDLMGNPRSGRVTPEMIETLFEAYGGSPDVE